MAKGNVSINRKCKHCGDEFIATNSNIYFCKKECAFWNKVDIKGPNDCWEWQGTRRKGGYGKFYNEVASRIAWELTNNKKLEKLEACHTCDNPPCCNPSHIWAGTGSQNAIDSVIKKRRVGETMSSGSMDSKKVLEVVEKIKNGDDIQQITKEYGVNNSFIYLIKNGRAWKHITGGRIEIPQEILDKNRKEAYAKRGKTLSSTLKAKRASQPCR